MNAPSQPFRIGFTGSRKGMTESQTAAIHNQIQELNRKHTEERLEAHHGDALGADTQFHAICQEVGVAVVIHPSVDTTDRAFNEGAREERPPQKFRQQSRSIVDSCDVLLAAPDGLKERLRGSGTWMTVRVARKAKRSIVLCFPDGNCHIDAAE